MEKLPSAVLPQVWSQLHCAPYHQISPVGRWLNHISLTGGLAYMFLLNFPLDDLTHREYDLWGRLRSFVNAVSNRHL